MKKTPVASKPLIGTRRLQARVRGLAREIADDYEGRELVMIGLMKGSFMFVADLARLLRRRGLPMRVDFMMLSSYGAGAHSSGKVRFACDIGFDIRNCHVLLVDDILDTGNTLNFAMRHLRRRRPASLKTCVLLDKPERRVTACRADYIGFTVPDKFVVGYGLDYAGRFREFPYISAI